MSDDYSDLENLFRRPLIFDQYYEMSHRKIGYKYVKLLNKNRNKVKNKQKVMKSQKVTQRRPLRSK